MHSAYHPIAFSFEDTVKLLLLKRLFPGFCFFVNFLEVEIPRPGSVGRLYKHLDRATPESGATRQKLEEDMRNRVIQESGVTR